MSRMDALNRWLLFAGVAGAAYVASFAFHPYPLIFALKAIPALTLCALSIAWLAGRERVVMAIAFAFAAAGDVFLDLDRTRYLPYGLGSFLVTQVCFAIAFAARAKWTPSRLPLILALAGAGATLLVVAWNDFGALRIPVIVYLAALLAMSSTALMARDDPWLARGALTFLVSDALIGVNRFVHPFDGSTALIVGLYFAAILMIARGVLLPRALPRE